MSVEEPRYSESWMAAWVAAASRALSVVEACDQVEVGLEQYHRGRIADTAFDHAALVFDQILDLKILSSVRYEAIKGDTKAQAMYYDKARLPAFIPAFPSWRSPAPASKPKASGRRHEPDDAPGAEAIDPDVAEVMIASGLEAAERLAKGSEPEPEPEPRPEPEAAKPRPRARKTRGGPPAPR